MEQTINTVTLRGSLLDLPQFSHENHGKNFFRFVLEVPRLSGAVDCIPVIAQESLVHNIDPTAGEMLTVTGQVRSHNQRTDGIRRLMIFVFAATVTAEDAINQALELHPEGLLDEAELSDEDGTLQWSLSLDDADRNDLADVDVAAT